MIIFLMNKAQKYSSTFPADGISTERHILVIFSAGKAWALIHRRRMKFSDVNLHSAEYINKS